MNTPMQPINVLVPRDAHRALRIRAIDERTSMQRLVIEALAARWPDLFSSVPAKARVTQPQGVNTK